MKLKMTALTKENFAAAGMKLVALVAFLVINLISYSAFSAEVAEKANLETQVADVSAIPSCQLASEGYVENNWKSVRIQIRGAVVAGAETLADLGQQLKKLVVENRCSPIPVSCSLAAEGLAMGSWVKHRIVVQDLIAFGSNTTGRLFDQLSELKNIGICQ